MDENNIAHPVLTSLSTYSRLQAEAKTVVYFASSNHALAVIAIADKIKPTSAAAIKALQDKGIEVYMLTGDNEQTAKAVAKQVGLKHYQS